MLELDRTVELEWMGFVVELARMDELAGPEWLSLAAGGAVAPSVAHAADAGSSPNPCV
jgi:hypothetical protein